MNKRRSEYVKILWDEYGLQRMICEMVPSISQWQAKLWATIIMCFEDVLANLLKLMVSNQNSLAFMSNIYLGGVPRS